jgi:hypothetical protein
MYIQEMYRDTEVIQGSRRCIGVQGYRITTGYRLTVLVQVYRYSTDVQELYRIIRVQV